MNRKSTGKPDAESPEWIDDDFKSALRFSDLPEPLREKPRRTRGPQKAPTKERVALRLSRDVVASFRATGPGWQTRIDHALQDWLKTHTPK